MKAITYTQFIAFAPCWLSDEERAAKLREYGARKEAWSALDILALDEVPAKDRLWAVLREELIDAQILHEFACRCAEEALKLVENPDPRSVAAIAAKRAWLRGEIGDDALAAARAGARYAAWDAAGTAACAAACAATRDAAWGAARDAAWGAARAGARASAQVVAWEKQLVLLQELLTTEPNVN